ncbi:unnamed protein product [Alternaria alternata]
MAKPIAILSLSRNRAVVRTIHEYVQPRGYIVGGVLDSKPFSAQELALALRVLEPRPQVLCIGRGYSEDDTSEARKIFHDYLKEVDIDVEKATVIKITNEVFDAIGKEKIPEWVSERLDEFFGKDIMGKM